MSKRLFFADYSDVMQQNFTDLKDIHTFAKICIDTYKNQLQGQTQAQANTVIRNKIREVAGLPENPNELQIKRAFKKESDREAIKADDMILNISKISGGHHNIERQRLNKGSEISVKTATYGAKVYMEMSRFLQGVEDWNELIDAISRAFTIQVNRMIHNQVMGAVKQLPVQTKWNRKGLANTANKKNFKELIADVKRATGSTAVIMGTEVALGELAGFGDVNWISEAAKNDIYTMGRLGNFEGTTIVELPNPFEYNDETAYLEADNQVIIMPGNIDKFVKFYYEGADEIVEHSEIADNGDDTKDYEFKTTMGVETITNRRFGVWKFEA